MVYKNIKIIKSLSVNSLFVHLQKAHEILGERIETKYISV